jgi:hypothetical protein
MPPISRLRSDYPLNLTLLEHVHACVPTWFYVAGLTPPRTLLISVIRHNGPASVSFYPTVGATSRSFACIPSARKSTFGLTPARASLCEFRLHIDEHLTTPIEHRYANPLNSILLRCRRRRCSGNPCHVPLLGSVLQRGTEGLQSIVSPLCRAVRGHRSKSSQIRRNT